MLTNFAGNLDWPAAAVLVAFAVCAAITVLTIGKHWNSKLELNNDLELKKYRERNTHEQAMLKVRADFDANMKRIEQGMITSHRVVPNPGDEG